MNSPIIKPPTKEAFHFPTSGYVADSNASAPKKKAPRGSDSKKAVTKAAKSKPTKLEAHAEAAVPNKAEPKKAVPKKAVPKKAQGAKKEKVLRDSFTMPKSDYAKIAELKQRCLDAGVHIKKSEILRAGLLLLAATSPKQFLSAVSKVEAIKTGRPAKA
ncbi:hypothetical protein RA280_40585 [Cupriavidus sp. CV2]|uniref:hypothetical protein n=1 Tax=Cupriavidus ulmosensis TaxID=3065913 RepID=UPI00296ADEF6|nr:hypothetical protein [Cupriavidus sp. CV2]MDW3687921.1 hypothetical protein [Cupriavidus sp. CV2]